MPVLPIEIIDIILKTAFKKYDYIHLLVQLNKNLCKFAMLRIGDFYMSLMYRLLAREDQLELIQYLYWNRCNKNDLSYSCICECAMLNNNEQMLAWAVNTGFNTCDMGRIAATRNDFEVVGKYGCQLSSIDIEVAIRLHNNSFVINAFTNRLITYEYAFATTAAVYGNIELLQWFLNNSYSLDFDIDEYNEYNLLSASSKHPQTLSWVMLNVYKK